MLIIYRRFSAAFMVAASIVMCGGAGIANRANAATSKGISAFDGRWLGNAYLQCSGVNVPMDIVIKDGDMSG